MSLVVGDRVKLGSKYCGTVEYIGELHGKEGVWVGLRLDDPVGTNNGIYAGMRYFTAEDKYGLFARYSRLEKVKLASQASANEASESDSVSHKKSDWMFQDKGSLWDDLGASRDTPSVDKRSGNAKSSREIHSTDAPIDTVSTARNSEGADNLFVRYDTNYIARLKEKIDALRLDLEEERRGGIKKRVAEADVLKRNMGAICRQLSQKVQDIKHELDALSSALKSLQGKIRRPRDKGDVLKVVEAIVSCITHGDVEGLNRNLEVYTKRISEQGIKFGF